MIGAALRAQPRRRSGQAASVKARGGESERPKKKKSR